MTDTDQNARFTDGTGYEKFMGQWSRIAGRLFLGWLSLPRGLRWLDVGCGTGAFTEIIQQSSDASEIIAIDPSAAQVSYAQSRTNAEGIEFRVADARTMPFENGRFDVAVSALVLNFIPNREKAVAEMRRVVRPGGTVAASVWDFAGGNETAQHLNSAVRELEGPRYRSPGSNPESATGEYLKALFEGAGLADVKTRPLDITVTFPDFDDYWNSNAISHPQVANLIKSFSDEKRQRLIALVKARLPVDDRGGISYPARVNAVKGRRV